MSRQPFTSRADFLRLGGGVVSAAALVACGGGGGSVVPNSRLFPSSASRVTSSALHHHALLDTTTFQELMHKIDVWAVVHGKHGVVRDDKKADLDFV